VACERDAKRPRTLEITVLNMSTATPLTFSTTSPSAATGRVIYDPATTIPSFATSPTDTATATRP
jgi:hypothetical protein